MLRLKKILSLLGVIGFLLASNSFSVKAADGDVYDLNIKSVLYTRTDYLTDVNKYKDVINLTTIHSEAFGLEKNSKVFKISIINDNIGNKIKAGMDLPTAITNAYSGIIEEGNSSDYSQVNENFDVITIE